MRLPAGASFVIAGLWFRQQLLNETVSLTEVGRIQIESSEPGRLKSNYLCEIFSEWTGGLV